MDSPRQPFCKFSCHALCSPALTGTWLLPHLHTREPKQQPRALPSHKQKLTPTKLAPSYLNIIASYATPRSSVVCEAHLKTCGLHKAIMLSIHSIHYTPTLRSVRLPGAHMPTLAIKAKHPTHFQRCFASRPQRLGATPPR